MPAFTPKILAATALACVGAALVVLSRQPDSPPIVRHLPTAPAETAVASVESRPGRSQQAASSAQHAGDKAATPYDFDDPAPLPSQEVVAHFDAWMAQARAGDADAARRIVDSLANCRRAANAGRGATVDGSIASPNAGRRRVEAEGFRRQCGAYRPEHYARLLEATEAGARAGSDYLRAEYYSLDPLRNGTTDPEQFDKYKDNAQRFLGELVHAGNPDGYLLMSDAYAAGRIVARDETTAYAYYLAWQQAGQNHRQSFPSAPPPYYTNLSADQVSQGQALSRVIQQKDSAP